MENNSHRYSNEDTTTSMYLSFDAESTMSTACYKTLEALSDTSILDMDNSVQNKTGDCYMNSTLEMNCSLKTVKKSGILDVKSNTPLKAIPKNILKEYKALCSTPSKDQLLKTVDVNRGSDATRCVDLGFAFLGVDDGKPAFFPPPPSIAENEENKENAMPDIEEVSTLSTCSSVEIASVIEKKISMSTAGSITEEECAEDRKVDKIIENSVVDSVEIKNEAVNKVEMDVDNAETINENLNSLVDEPLKAEEEITTSVRQDIEVEKNKKPQIAVLSRNSRLSVCEPNLQTGKPSRILSSENQRRSLLPTCKKPASIDAEIEIPLLMNKMLKITNSNKSTEENSKLKDKLVIPPPKINIPIDKRRSYMPTMNTRTTILPPAPVNKRPLSFAQRMSVVVKTTLNSPARKIARRSVMPTMQRKSLMPQTTTSAYTPNIKINENSLRKSMVPKPFVKPKIIVSLEEKPTKTENANSQRKSLYPLSKISEKDAVAGISQKKPDVTYTCNFCKEKFRIKSILDAHKRSHETDDSPAFVRKPMPIKQTSNGILNGNSNQCKYCDKKFALTKALHIHLLQNCPKIPPSEKRKLQYTELNHVEKAQLPKIFPNHNLQNKAYNTVANNKNFIKASSESLNDTKDKTSNSITTINGNNSTASKITAPKVKKVSAHSGVYRTPSKSVPCHLCKLTFKSVLEYTNHNLTLHSYKAKKLNDKDLE